MDRAVRRREVKARERKSTFEAVHVYARRTSLVYQAAPFLSLLVCSQFTVLAMISNLAHYS